MRSDLKIRQRLTEERRVIAWPYMEKYDLLHIVHFVFLDPSQNK